MSNLEAQYWRSLRQQAPDKRYEIEYQAFELGAQFKGLTPNQQRDFDYYLAEARAEKCYPNHFCSKSKLTYKPKTVEDWFWLWDTHGYSGPKELTQPNVSDCEGIKQAKEFTNLTIRMWVEDTVNGLWWPDEVKAAQDEMLPWMWKAYAKQLQQAFMKKIGFVPTYVRNCLGPRLCAPNPPTIYKPISSPTAVHRLSRIVECMGLECGVA